MLPGENISVSHIGLCENMLEAISQPQLHSLAPTFSTEVIILWLQRHYFANKGPSSQGYGFSSGHVWMWELDCEESRAPKNGCFWTVVLEKTWESLGLQGDQTSPS